MEITREAGDSEYGDRIIEYFAYTCVPAKTQCGDGRDLSFDFEMGISKLIGSTGLLGIVYGDTINSIFDEYTGNGWRLGSIGAWQRNGDQCKFAPTPGDY